ncbi:MAG: universal stress protein [Pseudomonadota bacterium]
MRRFRNILVYAESATAESLEGVIDLAREHDAALSICDVIAAPPSTPDPDGVIEHLKTTSMQLAYERLSGLCAPYSRSLAIDYTVLTGTPFLAVTEQVMMQGFDLVVHISDTGTHGGLNPTGMHLVRKCPCPVWSLPGVPAFRPRNIVLAVDRNVAGSGARTTAMAMAQAAMAASVAAGDSTRLHLVHAWQPFAEGLLQDSRHGLSETDIDDCVAAQDLDHQRWLSELADKLAQEAPGCVIETCLHRGEVTEVVPDVARETGAELIVMGTIGTSDVPGVLIGTRAEGILSTTRIPVLAVKPLGFKSPLRFEALDRLAAVVGTAISRREVKAS